MSSPLFRLRAVGLEVRSKRAAFGLGFILTASVMLTGMSGFLVLGTGEASYLTLYKRREEVAMVYNTVPFGLETPPQTLDVMPEADDPLEESASARKLSTKWLEEPSERMTKLRDHPQTRQDYWWDCLDSAADPECRPDHSARGSALPFAEWMEHTRSIMDATVKFRGLPFHKYFNAKFPNSSRYNGPWVENHWLDFFVGGGSYENMYPLVPIFVQWSDALHGSNPSLYDEAVELLFGSNLLRKDVLYVTLMQLDRVPPAKRLTCEQLRNIVVISASGWGNIAVPMLKGETEPIHAAMWPPDKDPVHNWPRKWIMNSIIDTTKYGRAAIAKPIASSLAKEQQAVWPYDPWHYVTHSVLFTVTPWGHDRAGYRFYENIRYGRVCLHVYQDEPWLPYQHTAEFAPPGTLPDRLAPGGERDVTAYGAVLQQSADSSAPTDGAGEPAKDPALWQGPLNDGGLWGPGGYGFAVHIDQLPSFLCIACEFVKPGSAARWRRVRTLPLHRYGKGPGQECPCTQAEWTSFVGSLGAPKNWTVPDTSLLYEMERRSLASADKYFSYGAIKTHLESLFYNPATSALKCVPRPAQPAPTYAALPVVVASA